MSRIVGVSGTHKAPVLSELAEWPGDLVAFWEIAIHPHISLQIAETCKDLRATGGVPPPGVKIKEAWFLVVGCGSRQSNNAPENG